MTDNLERRFQEHQSGENRSTRAYRPFKILYTELVSTRGEAREIEKKLKSGYGKEFLKSIASAIEK